MSLPKTRSEHYLVEKVARIIAGPDADQKLSGKRAGMKRWQLHVPTAIMIVREMQDEGEEATTN